MDIRGFSLRSREVREDPFEQPMRCVLAYRANVAIKAAMPEIASLLATDRKAASRKAPMTGRTLFQLPSCLTLITG